MSCRRRPLPRWGHLPHCRGPPLPSGHRNLQANQEPNRGSRGQPLPQRGTSLSVSAEAGVSARHQEDSAGARGQY